jgi:hypothetical protein
MRQTRVKHMPNFSKLKGLRLLVAFMGLWVQALAAGEQSLSFEGAWIRAVPPGMGMTAGFGTIRNDSSTDIVLTTFSSPDFGDVSLHRTEEVDGVSRMRSVASLRVPAGGAVELAPGAYHLMLMKPSHELEAGWPVTVRMATEDDRSFEFQVPVERR